jgi:hypothetical protein
MCRSVVVAMGRSVVDADDGGVLAQPRDGLVDVERVLRESLLITRQGVGGS